MWFQRCLSALKSLTHDSSHLLQVDEQVRESYQQTMSEWLDCEGIVRQREKEQHAAALAKCSSGASMDSSGQRMTHHDSTVSNEVSQGGESIHTEICQI